MKWTVLAVLPVLLIFFQNLSPVPVDRSVFHVYVAPDGNDSNSGLNPNQPLRTLNRANRVLANNLSAAPRDAVVHLAGGRYRGQVVRWSFSMPNNSIVIQGDDPLNRPTFDGATAEGQNFFINFVRDNARAFDKQNITLRYIRVQNYLSAVRIGGANADYNHSVGGITISNVVFTRIGRAFDPGPLDSHQAILITHSDGNDIRWNQFLNITNDITTPPGYTTYGGLHAIYIIRSNRTIIRRNTFADIYARGILKFRDFSNYTRVEDNHFYDKTNVLRDQYCDISMKICQDERRKFQLPGNECPSWGTSWKGNQMKYLISSIYNPLISTDFHTANEAFCTSADFFRFQQLDPRALEHANARFYRRVIDRGGNVVNPRLGE